MIEDNKVDFLQVTIRKMGDVVNMDPAVLQVGDEVADLLSTSFRRRRVSKVYKEEMLVTGARRVSKVYKEEMLVTGALAYAAGAEFVKYMPCLYPCLSLGLQNFEEHQVCSASVGAVGYICLALLNTFVIKTQTKEDEEIKAAMTLLGGLANALCSKLKMPLKVLSFWIDTLLRELQQSNNEQLEKIATWTHQMLGSLDYDPTDDWMVLD
ncbi:hypothetical protein POM88_052746 [Heracleum sosnowskyi]|uniref:Importin subunit beta-1/Transportin-1-like TPR repeats domain-containing protein n=1 Tax=Heracleum sosnowskyi TaxID=360622 RepID=A0AAD8LYC8_9APIA|nr:hypothetical protein POM88_052746 [Heracleum sosnowskyi]